MEWARILACITGTVDQELLLGNEFLAAENQILRPCGQKTGRHPRSAPKHADLPGVRMPRYSFHVCNSDRATYQDEVSTNWLMPRMPKVMRPLFAREFAEDNSWQGSHGRPWH